MEQYEDIKEIKEIEKDLYACVNGEELDEEDYYDDRLRAAARLLIAKDYIKGRKKIQELIELAKDWRKKKEEYDHATAYLYNYILNEFEQEG